ncbi:MAG: response regulator transcription factor [Bacteroidota bacterium]|nr:response regulator transcription factor [Bacteroidota bacterium]
MLRCVAIDDEPLALELLADNISKVPFLNLVAQCSDPLEALQVVRETQPDLIFLDIQMPGISGLQFLKGLTTKPMAIFITAYEKYALDSYSLDVIDYLVKPVALERFIKACNKAWELYLLRNPQNQSQAHEQNLYIFVNVEYSLVKVVLSDIVYIEGLKDYIKIHLHSTGKPVITRMNMKAIEDELPADRFLRIHKSFIVSIDYITSLRKSSLFLKEIELPVGEAYKDSLSKFTGKRNS